MPAKQKGRYPVLREDLDLEALEIVVTHIVEALDRNLLNKHEATHLKGMLVRASPYYRDKMGEFSPEILKVAHWSDWDGEQK